MTLNKGLPPVRLNQLGYRPRDEKVACVADAQGRFEVLACPDLAGVAPLNRCRIFWGHLAGRFPSPGAGAWDPHRARRPKCFRNLQGLGARPSRCAWDRNQRRRLNNGWKNGRARTVNT